MLHPLESMPDSETIALEVAIVNGFLGFSGLRLGLGLLQVPTDGFMRWICRAE